MASLPSVPWPLLSAGVGGGVNTVINRGMGGKGKVGGHIVYMYIRHKFVYSTGILWRHVS